MLSEPISNSFFFISFAKISKRTIDMIAHAPIVSGAFSQRPVRPIEFNARMKSIGNINALPTEIRVAKKDFY
jgi:hypothetical protein